MKKISVIIPCYNVSLFIDRCMESLEKQTIGMDNLEIILVNDASKDATLGKLLLWEMKYPDSIMVIPLQQNVRQGTARNIALEYCSGEYLAFLDADDWIIPCTLERLYTAAIDNQAEIVGYLSVIVNKGPEYDTGSYESNYENVLINIKSNEDRIRFFKANGIQRGCCDKFFLREFVAEHRFRFAEGVFDEEFLFTTHACMYVKRYFYVNEYLHRYFQSAISTIHNLAKDPSHRDDYATVWYALYCALRDEGVLADQHKLVEWLFVENYFIQAIRMSIHKGFQYDVETISEMQQTVRTLFPDFWKNELLVRPETRNYLEMIDMSVDENSIRKFHELWK